MRVAFVTSNYPTPSRPEAGTFVQEFVWAMARQGHECSVINPASVFDRRYGPYPPRCSVEEAGAGSTVRVGRPLHISFSSKDMGWTHTGRWTQWSFNYVAGRAVRALSSHTDVVYGHFLYHAGYAAARIGELRACPSVVGVGEDSPWTLDAFGVSVARRHFAKHGHFLANSTPNKEMLVNLLAIPPTRIRVEPNGVDLSRMYPRGRAEMKKKHGIDTAEFLVAFVGANETRKGPERVVEAIEGIPGVRCILVGRGTEDIGSVRILMSGPVAHHLVPELLSCADLFVLPTTSDGSCNAAIEAIACGLPIVTSNGRYMDEIVDDEVAIRIDPTDTRAIREAIVALKDDPDRRRRMSEACLRKAPRFDIDERARRVSGWMEELVRGHQT